ncbi:MAG TPA: metallopeptidase family protein [Kofleriaceae bacterium]|nr:metallopeptidase family protein [Kofleriaceae bacterium]
MRRLVAVVLLAACNGAPPSATSSATPEKHAGSATSTSPVSVAAATASPKSGNLIEGSVKPHHEEQVVECPAKVLDTLDDDAKVTALLDEANKQIEGGVFGAAWTCADRAADMSPTSVEAHHLRGAALAALGRDAEAATAYSLALALDPDDPETLRAVADFYINGKGERGRDALRLGLELAQRGSRRALARRRRNAPLAADLAVLEAQALNDLGRSDEALDRIDAALRIAPGRGDALHEKGVALFDLSRFADAKAAFQKALGIQPDDAYTHQMLGLTLEQLADPAADSELARAVKLAPNELTPPVLISKVEFQKEINTVIATLTPERRTRVHQIKLEIEDLPQAEDLKAVTPPFPPTILGLYRGPVGRAPAPDDEPSSIVLYRKNLARAVKTRVELTEQIRDTLLHEIGHLEGLDEDDLRRRGME